MVGNPILEGLMQRKSIRAFTDREPGNDVLEAIVRAGQQAPFAAQLGSLLLKRDRNPFSAPLLFTACVDIHRMEAVLAKRGWTRVMCDAATLMLGVQDAAYMIQNMVIAAESLGLGSCYLGAAPFAAAKIIEEYALPPRVFPVVQLAMGYPAEDPPVRPRYPLESTLFEDRYPVFDDTVVARAMEAMDAGYLAQDYYRELDAKLPLSEGREETFTHDDYSWTEHISRKLGQWSRDPSGLIDALAACDLHLDREVETL